MVNFDEITKSKVELDPNSILKNGYGLIAQEVMRNKNISCQAKAIYSYLCSMAGNDGIAYPTQDLMMDELNLNKATFLKYLKEILSLGYIKVTQTRKNGKAYKNVYTIAMDKRDIEPNRKAYAKIAKENKRKAPLKQVNNLRSQCHKIYDTDVQCHKKQESEIYDSKSINFKSNIVVVDDVATSEKENKVIDLYKSFKLEKKVMPHTIKLLKEYSTKFDLEIFEDIFINTLEAKADSNYRYIKKIFEVLVNKGITTFEEYKNDSKSYKQNKSKNLTKSNKSDNSLNKNIKTRYHNINQRTDKYTEKELEVMIKNNQKNKSVKTKLHNCNETFTKYNPEELEKLLQESQRDKFNNKKPVESNLDNDWLNDVAEYVYKKAKNGNWNELSEESKKIALKYAEDNKFFIPMHWRE